LIVNKYPLQSTFVHYWFIFMRLFDSPAMRETIRRLIRSQMAAKGVEYRDLAKRLEALGVIQSDSNLRSKVNNGSLGAQLFLYIELALGVGQIDLKQVSEIYDDVRVKAET
jgi:hypothetical protein